jgi:hypothetical protein
MTTEHGGRGFGWLWKIPLIAVAYFVATMISGELVLALGMEFPEFPALAYSPVRSLLAALVLGAALYLLARGVRGSSVFRWFVLFAFTYISFCVNNQIEVAIFTTIGGFDTMLIFFIIPCALVAGAAALLIKPPDEATVLTTVFSDRPTPAWWWRATLAWLAFPVIYYFFGMLIYPFVADAYEGGELGLVVPSQSVILSAVTFRSLLFLLVTIPILTNWSRSRRSLMLALAAAFTAMVGVVGMIEAGWMTTTLRIGHGLEITADSIVHAWVLTTLLVPKSRAAETELSTIATD